MVEHGSEKEMEGFFIVEKRVPIFDGETLQKLGEMNVHVSGGSGIIHAHIWIPQGQEESVFEYLKSKGFIQSRPYDKPSFEE